MSIFSKSTAARVGDALRATGRSSANPKQWSYSALDKASSLGWSAKADDAIAFRGIKEEFDVSKIAWYEDPTEATTDTRSKPWQWQWKENAKWKRKVLNPWGWVDGHGFCVELVPHYVDMVTQRMADPPIVVPKSYHDENILNVGPRPRPFGQLGSDIEAKRHPKKIVKLTPHGVAVDRWCQTKFVKHGFFEHNDPEKLAMDPHFDRDDIPTLPKPIPSRASPRRNRTRSRSAPCGAGAEAINPRPVPAALAVA